MRNVKRKVVFERIVEALLVDYVRVYYLDAASGEYEWYSSDADFNSMNFDHSGNDFFAGMIKEMSGIIYQEDREYFCSRMRKDNLLEKLRENTKNTLVYRLLIDGVPRYHSLQLLDGGCIDGDEYYILGVRDIDSIVRIEEGYKLFNHVAACMAKYFDAIYYVDIFTEDYYEFTSSDLVKVLDNGAMGRKFFSELKLNAQKMVWPEDRSSVVSFLEKDRLVKELRSRRICKTEYRLMAGNEPVYVRLTAVFADDDRHIIICIANIDQEMRDLKNANSEARIDSLTGVRNNRAYRELERILQDEIDNDSGAEYAIVVCDLNDLKTINDTKGHADGDQYIKEACRMICEVFAHSPVYRIGGDEFTAVLMHNDYIRRDDLTGQFRERVKYNKRVGKGPVVASGMASYIPGVDNCVSDTFKRADALMYEDKRSLKRM